MERLVLCVLLVNTRTRLEETASMPQSAQAAQVWPTLLWVRAATAVPFALVSKDLEDLLHQTHAKPVMLAHIKIVLEKASVLTVQTLSLRAQYPPTALASAPAFVLLEWKE